MKLRLIVALGVLALGGIGVAPSPSRGQELASGESIPLAWSADATLRDIHFTDENSGIAVGDLGTVLRTTDGGRTWKPIFINNDCGLQSISFSDGERGWIAGGYSLPFVPHSRGVLLQTTNGGAAWAELPNVSLPAIKQVEFVNERLGLAQVVGSEFHPSGLCSTSDVGKSWAELAPETVWQAGAVARGASGVIAAHGGRLGLIRERSFQPSRQPGATDQAIRAIAMLDPHRGYALGDRNLWATNDAGESWEQLPLPPELLASPYRTWTTLAARGNSLWLAGSPGTQIAQIDLQAQTVRLVTTPIRTTLQRLFFLNEALGWAVGDLGTILVTRDGGNSWSIQRSAGPRVAILFVARTAAELPFELLARFCGDQGYLGAALIFADPTAEFADAEVRSRQAVQRLGVPLLVTSAAPTQTAAELEIGRLIRQIQPSTLVIAQAPAFAVRNGLDLPSAAASAAGTAAQFDAASPFQTETELPYWQTPKVLLTVAQPDPDSAWGSAELLPKLSRNITDYVLPSRGLANCAAALGVRYETTYLNGLSLERDSEFFDATQTGPLAPPQREPLQPQGYLSQIKAMSTKAQLLQPLLETFDDDPQAQKVWDARLTALCSELPRDVAGVWLWQLAQAYGRHDKPRLAALTRHKLLAVCPQHAFALETQRWLIHYYASAEMAYQESRRIPTPPASPVAQDEPPASNRGRTVMREIELDGVKHMVWVPETSHKTPTGREAEGRQVAATSGEPQTFSELYRQRLEQARSLLNQLSASAGDLTARPEWTWLDLALTRQLEGPLAFESRAARVARGQWSPPQWEWLRRELLLAHDEAATADLPLVDCPLAVERPYLDGILDDHVWRGLAQQDKILRLRPVITTPATPIADAPATAAGVQTVTDPNLGQTQVLFARDAEFLYVAIQCHFVELTSWRESSDRERDRDQVAPDQIEIRIDVDRDGASGAVFQFDIDGNFADRLEGNRGWNPDWYFAQSRSFNTWTIEAAIPLELWPAADESLRGNTWGLTIERKLPHGVRERWQPTTAVPAASKPTSEFELVVPDGYLRVR